MRVKPIVDVAFVFGPFRLIPSQQVLVRGNRPVKLGGRALDILHLLVMRAGEEVSKNALIECAGNQEEAMALLRKQGTEIATKRQGRKTANGIIYSYIHAGNQIGVMVEVNCESDFVARTEDFKELIHDIAMHIAASDPKFVRKEDVTPEAFEREKDIYRAQAIASGKPANIAEKMVAGKMEKFYEEVCLLEQPFIKDQTISISQLIATKIGKLGENISVRRFARFKVGDVTATVAFTSPKADEGGDEPAAPAGK